MGYPRARLVDFTSPGYYHCISRCGRRGFLCGDQYEHRRQWIEERLAELLEVFAIDACGYAIMSNHFHLTTARRTSSTSWRCLPLVLAAGLRWRGEPPGGGWPGKPPPKNQRLDAGSF